MLKNLIAVALIGGAAHVCAEPPVSSIEARVLAGVEAVHIGDYGLGRPLLEDLLKRADGDLDALPLDDHYKGQLTQGLLALYWQTGRDRDLLLLANETLPEDEAFAWGCRVLEREGDPGAAHCWMAVREPLRARRAVRQQGILMLLPPLAGPPGQAHPREE